MLRRSALAPMVRDRLYEQVAQQIQQLIVAEGWPAGSRIPTERELGEQFGVSRTVVREALKALSERGLVEIRPGRGTFVADPGVGALKQPMKLFYQRQNVSLRDLVEARRVVEIEVAQLAAQRAMPEQIEQLRAAIQEMDAAMGDVERFVRADQRFHVLLAEATQNRMFPMLTESMAELLYESRLLTSRVTGSSARGQRYHRALLEAVERRDPEAARRAMEEHLAQVDSDSRASREVPGAWLPEAGPDSQDGGDGGG